MAAQAATQAAVLAARHLAAGEAPPAQQLAVADPEALAQELAIALGMHLPFLGSDAENAHLGPPAQSASLPALGRPLDYTEQEGLLICRWIADGNSLNSYCRLTGRRPHTVYGWMSRRADFRDAYARAHADRADTLVDQMLAIADNLPKTVSMEQVKRAELQISTRKWCAERLRPSKWGLQQTVGPQQPITFNIGIAREPTQVTIEPPTLPSSD